MSLEPAFSPELLRVYYARLFPYDAFCRWLTYDAKSLSKRELCFTLANDVYCRYQTFAGPAELKSGMLKAMPHKIDVGAVFNMSPSEHKSPAFKPEQRELVFDIDLSDYDDVRTCCQGATVCRKCWRFVCAAVKVMDACLRQDFGFRHVLWVYSGRRGVHCWVADKTARDLTNDARSAVVSYCSCRDKIPWPVHPSLQRAYAILEPIFADHIIPQEGQGWLADSDHWNKLLATLPDQTKAKRIGDHWDRPSDRSAPIHKWDALKNNKSGATTSANKKLKTAATPELWKYDTVFSYTYPRLDENVSKQRNHLLKSPFSVHPKTGRVCVPFDPAKVDDFDPAAVPT